MSPIWWSMNSITELSGVGLSQGILPAAAASAGDALRGRTLPLAGLAMSAGRRP